jgi:RNA-binding protein YlmH
MISFKDRINNIVSSHTRTQLRFLTLSEQAIVTGIMKYVDDIELVGGYPEAERKRALFFTNEVDISCFLIKYNKKHLLLTHQNILGSLLSLKITRDSIGDILPIQGVFFITREIEQEVIHSFQSINRVPIELVRIDSSDIRSETNVEDLRITVSSMRLDTVISKIIRKSRTEAVEVLTKEYIKVNHTVETKATKTIKDNDVISIRHYGRYKIMDSASMTKKGKIIINYVKYI